MKCLASPQSLVSVSSIYKLFLIVFLLFSSIISVQAKTRLLLDNFEDGDHRNELGGYWYTFDDRFDIFGKVDRITGKQKIPDLAELVDTNGNGIFDVPSYVYPTPDPTGNMTPYQPAPYGVNGSRFCGSFTYDLTMSEFKYPYAAMGTNFLSAGTNKDVLEVDNKMIMDLSEYTGVSFWVKATTGIPKIMIKFIYKNGPGEHGETPRQYEVSISTEWEFKVVEFSNFRIPTWVFTHPFYSDQANGFPPGTIKSTENKWDKIKAIQFQTMDGAKTNAPKGTIWVDDIYLVAVSTEYKKFDTDNDGYNDYIEYAAGTNVNDANSYPSSDLNRNAIADLSEDVLITEIRCTPDPFYPNQENVYIRYNLSRKDKTVKAKTKIFDICGRLIVKDLLPEQTVSGGQGELSWSGKDENGKIVPEGIYIVSVEVTNGAGKKNSKCKTVIVGNK